MNDWDEIIKPLTVTPVTQDTTINTKPLTTESVRAIGLVYRQVVVPDISLTPVGVFQVPYIVYQFNYSASSDFRIINFGDLQANPQRLSNCILCVRYRVGTAVYRYQICGSTQNLASVPSELYNGQLIKANFVVEIWQINTPSTLGVVNALSLMTSIIRTPTGQDDYLPDSTSSSVAVTLTGLQAAINPEALPTTYNTNGSWLTN